RDAQFNTVPYIEKKGNFVSRLLTSILPHKVHLPEHSVPQENNTLNELAVPDAKERESFVSRLFTTILPHKVHPPEHSGTPTGSYVEKLNGERSNTPKGPHG